MLMHSEAKNYNRSLSKKQPGILHFLTIRQQVFYLLSVSQIQSWTKQLLSAGVAL